MSLYMRLTRRQMILGFGVGSLGALGACLAGCSQPTPTPTPKPEPTKAVATTAPQPTAAPTKPVATPKPAAAGTVVFMHQRNEWSEAQEKQFMADNPSIKIEFIEFDATRFMAMNAAGNPPDLFRLQGPEVPDYLARKILKNLQPYFDTSGVLKLDDLAPANAYYKWDGQTIGKGDLYGMCKDWSPDFTLFINKKAFAETQTAIPSDDKPLTYQDVAELAKKLTKKEGDRTLRWGYAYPDSWLDRMMMNLLAEKGKALFANSYSKIVLAGDPDVVQVAKYFFDLCKANYVPNPLNPSPNWIGDDFTKEINAICQYGYWFSAMAESDLTKGNVVMLPAPTWAGVRRDPTMTATGMAMTAKAKNPDAAWKLFEHYNGGQPSIDRAKSGWGVPALKSQYSLMPRGTDSQKQVQKVLQAEMQYAGDALQFCPFIKADVVYNSWSKYLEDALRGKITFDEMLKNVENETNTAIKEGIDRLG
jgi:multiple sugar transport system substrate-binding protein